MTVVHEKIKNMNLTIANNYTFKKNRYKHINLLKLMFLVVIYFLFLSSLSLAQAEDITEDSINQINNTSQPDSNTLNKSQVLNSGTKVANFIEKKKKLPDNITVGTKVVKMPQYLYAVTSIISGSKNVTLFYVSKKRYKVSRFSTRYTLSHYTSLARRTKDYINKYKKIPPYLSSAHGNIDYYNMIYIFSKIARYYNKYNKLPTSVYLKSQIPNTARVISSSTVDKRITGYNKLIKSTRKKMRNLMVEINKTKKIRTLKNLQNQYDALKLKYVRYLKRLSYYKKLKSSPWYIPYRMRKYLKETKYSQITSANIVYQTMSLRETKPYETGKNIFNWIRDTINYSFYYRTKYGAVKTLLYRKGNCADQSHLVVAMARSAGLPARYVRGTCKFIVSGNTYTHVWAQIWIKGKGWVTADTTNTVNSFGIIRSWNRSKSRISGTLTQYSL